FVQGSGQGGHGGGGFEASQGGRAASTFAAVWLSAISLFAVLAGRRRRRQPRREPRATCHRLTAKPAVSLVWLRLLLDKPMGSLGASKKRTLSPILRAFVQSHGVLPHRDRRSWCRDRFRKP